MSGQEKCVSKPNQSTLEAVFRRLRVDQIKAILREVSVISGTRVSCSGVRKAALVTALVREIIRTFQNLSRESYEQALSHIIYATPGFIGSTQYIWRDSVTYGIPSARQGTTGSQHASSSSAAPHGPNCTCGHAHTTQRLPTTTTVPSSSSFVGLQFTPSGYIVPLERISDPVIFNDTRGRVSTATIPFRLSVDQADMADRSRRAGNGEYRVYWYMCQYADACNYLRQNPKRPVFLGYPYNCTMYLNAQQLSVDIINGRKPNYPIDITSLSKMSSDETNQLSINYRNNGMHVGMVMLAKVHTPASIIKEIRTKNLVSADEVRKKFFKGPEPGNDDDDDDLISTGSLVSLKCPLGLMRITTPTRSKYCQHPQCFDCETFLQMKNQVPSTKCPVCSQEIKSWEELVIDLYFEDILQKTSPSDDQVYIEADGSWKPKQPIEAEDVDSLAANKRLRRNGDPDAIDLSDYNSEEDRQLNRNKRQRTEVIDLTIDSDDSDNYDGNEIYGDFDDYEDHGEYGDHDDYGDEEIYTEDMSFDESFPPLTQEDIALIDAVEASSRNQNDRSASVAVNTGINDQTVVTPRRSQQTTPVSSASRPSQASADTSAQSNSASRIVEISVGHPLPPSTVAMISRLTSRSTSAAPRAPATPSHTVVSPSAANPVSRATGADIVHTNGSARSARSVPTPKTNSSHNKTNKTPTSRPRVLDTTTDRTQGSGQIAGTLASPTGTRGSRLTPTRLATSHYPNVMHQFMTLPPSRSGVAVASFNLPTSVPTARVRESTSNHALPRNGSLPTSPTRIVGMSPAYISLIANQGLPGSNASPTSPSNGQHAPNGARPSA